MSGSSESGQRPTRSVHRRARFAGVRFEDQSLHLSYHIEHDAFALVLFEIQVTYVKVVHAASASFREQFSITAAAAAAAVIYTRIHKF